MSISLAKLRRSSDCQCISKWGNQISGWSSQWHKVLISHSFNSFILYKSNGFLLNLPGALRACSYISETLYDLTMEQDLGAKLSDTRLETGLWKSKAFWVEDSIRWNHLSLQGSSAVGGASRSKYKWTLGFLSRTWTGTERKLYFTF